MRKLTLLLLTVFSLNLMADDKTLSIDLSGIWQFALDRQNLVHPDYILTETVSLPGTTDTNKKGDFIDKSEETTHLSRPWSYKGRAWYKREVEIPAEWKGKTVYLLLERTKPSEVYVDAKFIGACNDISTPQVFDLSKVLTPGKHTLAIMVDNSSGVPEQLYANSHAYTEDTQTNWNGIIGRIELTTAPFAVVSPQSTHPNFRNFHIEGRRGGVSTFSPCFALLSSTSIAVSPCFFSFILRAKLPLFIYFRKNNLHICKKLRIFAPA